MQVMSLYITGHLNVVFSAEHRKEILRYIYCHQNEDGGWGLYIGGHSTIFCTALNYVCMRLLGEGPDGGLNNVCERSRKWILDHGGVTTIPSWRKTWLSILGVYEWSGCHPNASGVLALSFLYSRSSSKNALLLPINLHAYVVFVRRKFVGPITPLISQLRQELHIEPYAEISWSTKRHICAKEDLHYPHTLLQTLLWDSLYMFSEPSLNRWPFKKLREKALKLTMDLIHYEDESSHYIIIGCVEKPLCMLACWVEDPNGIYFKKHLSRVADYIWVGEDGIKMQSFGSQVWDASFLLQAMLASNLSDEIGPTLMKGHNFLKNSQYSHPDNMSSAEKLKIELAKVRDEFKMSESDCGSARVQVAQLTTKIKHLSSVLHKKIYGLKCEGSDTVLDEVMKSWHGDGHKSANS
ncbi:hypothetical protein PTKIN_Ptkin13bG0142300 [Pterospermum kingtungense]